MNSMLTPIMAALSINTLLWALFQAGCIGAICGILWWLVRQATFLPVLAKQFCQFIIALILAVGLINVILTLMGRPFITF